MNSLIRDPVEVITRHLEPVDIARWSVADKRKGRWLKPLFYKRLIEKVDNLFRAYFASVKVQEGKEKFVCSGSYENFLEAMIASKGVISGSFVLQMINGQKYSGSDIDIYSEFNLSTLWPHMRLRIEANDIQIAFWPRHDDDFVGSRYDHSDIVVIREYTIKEKSMLNFVKFQTIVLSKTPKDYIKAIFDFSVLRNILWYDKDGWHVEIEDLKGIMNNVIKFDQAAYFKSVPNAKKKKVAKRIAKYEARGFTFI